jgi:hypothetical protein
MMIVDEELQRPNGDENREGSNPLPGTGFQRGERGVVLSSGLRPVAWGVTGLRGNGDTFGYNHGDTICNAEGGQPRPVFSGGFSFMTRGKILATYVRFG